jgi:hypothetical protein
LSAARANVRPRAQADGISLLTGLRALLARIPIAWGAVAAIWVVIIGANSLMSGPAFTTAASGPTAAPGHSLAIWSLQRAELSLLADGPGDLPEVRPRPMPPAAPPAPRSDRRRDDGFGGFEREDGLCGAV